MKQLSITIIILIIVCAGSVVSKNNLYSTYFTDQTMRVDYFHSGTKGQEFFSMDKVYEDGGWSGSKTNLIDNLNLGEYLVKVFDVSTNAMIFSHGYSTIFN